MTLVEVPFSVKRKNIEAFLITTLSKVRPDLLLATF